VFGTAGLILVGLATVMAFSKTVDSLSDKLVGTNVQ